MRRFLLSLPLALVSCGLPGESSPVAGPAQDSPRAAEALGSGDESGAEVELETPGARVGDFPPALEASAWDNSEPLTLSELRGQVVVVRFWTNTCPYCRASMPAIESLSQEFKGEPVTFVGLYHAKPSDRRGAWDEAKEAATTFGVHFPIAYDEEWKTLNAWWLRGGVQRATSASFVIGSDGKVTFVHPGPVFFPSDDPAESKQNEDYLAVRAAIRKALDAIES